MPSRDLRQEADILQVDETGVCLCIQQLLAGRFCVVQELYCLPRVQDQEEEKEIMRMQKILNWEERHESQEILVQNYQVDVD